MWPHWINIVVSITALILVIFYLLRKNINSSVVKIYTGLFLAEQIIGYKFNIDLFKINIPTNDESGTIISLFSIFAPLLLAYIVNYLYEHFEKPQL